MNIVSGWRTSVLSLRALPVLAAALALAGCEQFAPPVCFDCMSVQRPGIDATDYLVTLRVENNNDQPIRIEEVHWTLSTGQTEITSGTMIKEIELQPRKSVPLDIYIQLPQRTLEKAGLMGRRQFEYELVGQVKFGSPLGGAESKFVGKGRLPVIHPLKVDLCTVETSGVTESQVGLVINTLVTNPNDIPLTPSQFTGGLLIKERPLIALDKEPIETDPIPPGQAVRVPIKVWVSSPEVGVKTLARLVAAPDTRFRLVGAMQFRVSGNGNVEDLFSGSPAAAPASQKEQ